MAKKTTNQKFQFGTDFQSHILQYTISNKYGYKILHYFKDDYFTLISHQFVAFALHRYFKKKKRLPQKVAFKEYTRQLYTHKDYNQYLTKDIREDIKQTVEDMYSGPVPDSDDIVEQCIQFARYVGFKEELENIDINDYSAYEQASARIKNSISIGRELDDKTGIFLVAKAQERLIDRINNEDSNPTPFWQWNASLNSNGLGKGDLVMLMAKPKRFKTGALLNIAKGYMRMRKKVLYIDLENGEQELSTRTDQSLLKKTQNEILSGDLDAKLLKHLRKLKRLGAELYIKRMPALKTNCDDIQKVVDEVKEEYGIHFDVAIVDYGDLLGSISGKRDDTERISDAYLDMKNLALYNEWEAIITASHVTRAAEKREGTKYVANDVAKCIDKIRHLDVCLGLQETEDEKLNGVMRFEVIEQRNGPQNYPMFFWVDIATQNMKELTRKERDKVFKHLDEVHEKQKEVKSDV